MEIKQMVYGSDPNITELLYADKYKGIQFAVVNNDGLHPCGYVEVTGTKYDECSEWNELSKEEKKNYWKAERPKERAAERDIDCHGGVTFSRGFCPGGIYDVDPDTWNASRWFIGWDYGHSGDYICFGSQYREGTQWTTEEVISECKRVIDQIYGDNNDKGNDS